MPPLQRIFSRQHQVKGVARVQSPSAILPLCILFILKKSHQRKGACMIQRNFSLNRLRLRCWPHAPGTLLFQWTFPTNMDILLHSRNATDKVGKWTWIHYCHFIVLLYSHCPMLSFITEGSTSEPWSIWLSLVASYWKGPSVSPWLSWPYYRPVFLEKVPQFWFVWRFPMIRFSCRSLTKISRKWSFCIPLPASSQVTCTWVWLHPLQVMCTLITWLRRCLPGFSTIKVLTSLCGL